MVNYCRVLGWHNRSDRDNDKHYYRLPEVVTREGKKTRELSEERRRLWLANLHQDFAGKNLKNIRVCSDHFVNGKKAALYERESPDWAPTVNMGTKVLRSPYLANDRFQRRNDRNRKADAARTLLSISQDCEELLQVEDSTTDQGMVCQTELTCVGISAMQTEISYLQTKNQELSDQLCDEHPYSMESMKNNDEKVKHFTGLTCFSVLFALFQFLEAYISAKLSLSKFETLMLTLIKLRLNLSNQFLSYQFKISQSNVSRSFTEVIDVMYIRMKPLVYWPDRETLRLTMPMQFRQHFGTKCAVIIDCFEVFIERPSNLKARAETWSSYKHHNTVKFLLGITPQGVISFISKSWGGRTSDKHITENCGFLHKILPGDLVLADRGFDIQASIGSMCAEVKIPAFTKGKSQLSPLDMATTRKIANVRIHVERVIGLVRQKYTILNGTLPIDFLIARENENIPLVDKIAYVCCGLVNMCEPVVNFD
ncbi:uncharacterized protein LOC132757489 [Ruditapes philippinarum]|uniref:uncharacterized protein LOC132757489 n=1 Tax=Ruditapes philippinarum TaxID=129788 RepID=UPI00295AAF27|nr:uncharacterized protein LOC132757489 [Ruditapes philippinarum]